MSRWACLWDTCCRPSSLPRRPWTRSRTATIAPPSLTLRPALHPAPTPRQRPTPIPRRIPENSWRDVRRAKKTKRPTLSRRPPRWAKLLGSALRSARLAAAGLRALRSARLAAAGLRALLAGLLIVTGLLFHSALLALLA